MELPGLKAGHAGSRILHKLEVDLLKENFFAPGKPVGALVAPVRHIVWEPLEPNMAVGLPIDELQRAGAYQINLAALAIALARRHDRQRRHEARQLVKKHGHPF